MEATTTLSKTDLALFKKAQVALAVAQDRFQFVSQHITETYALKPEDQVDLDTGAILRPEPKKD